MCLLRRLIYTIYKYTILSMCNAVSICASISFGHARVIETFCWDIIYTIINGEKNRRRTGSNTSSNRGIYDKCTWWCYVLVYYKKKTKKARKKINSPEWKSVQPPPARIDEEYFWSGRRIDNVWPVVAGVFTLNRDVFPGDGREIATRAPSRGRFPKRRGPRWNARRDYDAITVENHHGRHTRHDDVPASAVVQ